MGMHVWMCELRPHVSELEYVFENAHVCMCVCVIVYTDITCTPTYIFFPSSDPWKNIEVIIPLNAQTWFLNIIFY